MRLCEGRIDGGRSPFLKLEAHIVGKLRPDLRGAGLQAGCRRDHGGQGGVVDVDTLRRVARLVFGFGDDHRDDLANIAHDIARDHRLRHRHLGRTHRRQRGLVRALGQRRTHLPRQTAEPVGVGFCAGEHGEHARHRARGSGIDCDNSRMRMDRTHEDRMRLAGQDGVGYELSGAGDQGKHPAPQRACADAGRPLGRRRSGLQIAGGVMHYGWMLGLGGLQGGNRIDFGLNSNGELGADI